MAIRIPLISGRTKELSTEQKLNNATSAYTGNLRRASQLESRAQEFMGNAKIFAARAEKSFFARHAARQRRLAEELMQQASSLREGAATAKAKAHTYLDTI